MLDAPGQALKRELLEIFAAGADRPLPDDRFDAHATRIFAYQFEHNAPYAAYCRRRGVTPASVAGWRGIPAVPTVAFKEIVLLTGDASAAEAVFRTSGTTRGHERRGAHYLLDLELYERSLLPAFRAYVLPDGAQLPMLSLLPHADELPDSSLAYMLTVLVERLGAEGSDCFADAARGLDDGRLLESLHSYEANGRPVCLLGTSLSFLHLLDAIRGQDVKFRLAAGSRLMDTGGFKGAAREVEPSELRARYVEHLGIAPDHCINEYGMTELCSQLYESGLRSPGDATQGRKLAPPWLRTLAADPETLAPLTPGETGLLRHVDLANLSSVIAVQTEDVGYEVAGGCVLLGRAPGAAPRGCSIAADMLLEAAGHRTG